MSKAVAGFCYVTGQPLTLTAADWRKTYAPPGAERRVPRDYPMPETHYYSHGRRVAEAYAIIPAGGVK